jgi:hypothetical protein
MRGNIEQGIMRIEKKLSPLLALPCLILSLSNPKKAKMNQNSISPLFLSHMSLYSGRTCTVSGAENRLYIGKGDHWKRGQIYF